MRGFDVRSVANVVLKRAEELGVKVTNLHLNKALFFMHVDCLRDCGHPLVSAKIEAWEYGPVFREVYNQFRKFKGGAITDLAKRVSYESGQLVVAEDQFTVEETMYMRGLADFYLSVPASVLVDVSHARGGAWDHVWSKNDGINAGMEITETVIRKHELPAGRRIKVQ